MSVPVQLAYLAPDATPLAPALSLEIQTAGALDAGITKASCIRLSDKGLHG